MKDWLKFFGVSFFSDKIAKTAAERSILNFFLGFLLALVFIFCGSYAANTVPVMTHYRHASAYGEFVRGVTENAALTVDNSALKCDSVINTYKDGDAEKKYAVNGYHLIIDTRPANSFDDFIATCAGADGKEISYKDYLSLSEDGRKGYAFKITYTDELLDPLTRADEYRAFLSTADESYKSEYEKLEEERAQTGEKEYGDKLYKLWLRAYYAPVNAFAKESSIPLLRNFYYLNYLNDTACDKFLALFDDMAFSHFSTDGGLQVALYGAYHNVADGAVTSADAFIKGIYRSYASLSASVYFFNIFRFAPIFIVMPLLIAAVFKLILRLTKSPLPRKYTGLLNTVGSFVHYTALFTAIITFICGFFTSAKVLNILPIAIFAALITVRSCIYFYSALKESKLLRETQKADGTDDTDGADGAEESDDPTETQQ